MSKPQALSDKEGVTRGWSKKTAVAPGGRGLIGVGGQDVKINTSFDCFKAVLDTCFCFQNWDEVTKKLYIYVCV